MDIVCVIVHDVMGMLFIKHVSECRPEFHRQIKIIEPNKYALPLLNLPPLTSLGKRAKHWKKNVLAKKLSLLNTMVTASYPDVSLDKNVCAKEGGEEIDVKTKHKC